MKKLNRVAMAFASVLEASNTCERNSRARARPEPERVGLRLTASDELQQFCRAWALKPRQVVAVLVFVRVWLHNLLVREAGPESDLQPGDAEVLLAYSRWLDGFPEVVRALPEAVAMDEEVVVRLKPPACLPESVWDMVGAVGTPEDKKREVAPAAAAESVTKSILRFGGDASDCTRHDSSNAARRDRESRRLGFIDYPLPVNLPASQSRRHGAARGR